MHTAAPSRNSLSHEIQLNLGSHRHSYCQNWHSLLQYATGSKHNQPRKIYSTNYAQIPQLERARNMTKGGQERVGLARVQQ